MSNSLRMVSGADLDSRALNAARLQVWPEEENSADCIASVLRLESHHSAAFVEDGRVAAFVDGFLTHSGEGVPRWEVDLLGTLAGYRGQGLARRLIEDNLRAGWQRGAAFSRALIQLENHASQRAFAACGFAPAEGVVRLWVCSRPLDEPAPLPPGQHLVPVETFNYRGVWLEGELSAQGLRAARAWLPQGGGQICGVLVPREREDLHQAAQNEGYAWVNDYQWWLLSRLEKG